MASECEACRIGMKRNTHFTLSSKSSKSASNAASVAFSYHSRQASYKFSDLVSTRGHAIGHTSLRAHTSSSLSSLAVLRMRRNDARNVAAVCSDDWISCCTAWYGSVDMCEVAPGKCREARGRYGVRRSFEMTTWSAARSRGDH